MGRRSRNPATPRAVRVAVYAGSFDPPTLGHLYVIREGARLFDKLFVTIGVNPQKCCRYGLQDRLRMLRGCTRNLPNVRVESFEGRYLVHYAREVGAGYTLRGVRDPADFAYETIMRQVNSDIDPRITTLLLIPPRQLCEISSSFIKGLLNHRGWEEAVRPYLPPAVYRILLKLEGATFPRPV